MRPVRTALIFASGVAVYALMAACGGGSDTNGSQGGGQPSTSSTGASHPVGSGGMGAGGNGASSGGGTGGVIEMGGGGASTTGASTGGASASSASGTGGAGGSGGGSNGLRLLPEYNAGTDGARDATFALTPWFYEFQQYGVYTKAERYFWDTHRQEECVYVIAADGKERCLPTDVSSGVAYGDAACTQRVVAIPAQLPGCQIHIPKYAETFDYNQSSCAQVGFYPAHLYPVGAFLGSNLACYANDTGTCKASGCNGSSNGYAVYAVGSEISPSKFVAGALTHD